MYSYFEVKVQYTNITGDDSAKPVKESYMTDNATFGAAEKVVLDHVKPFATDMAEAVSIKKLKVYNVLQLEDGKDHIYCAKVKYITIEDSGAEHSVVNRVYIGANTLTEAKELIQKGINGLDADLVGIEETKMVKYVNPAPNGQESAD